MLDRLNRRWLRGLFCWTGLLLLAQVQAASSVVLSPVRTVPTPFQLSGNNLAVVVNDDDPNSVAVAQYYQKVRQIPEQNIVHVVLPVKPHRLTADAFRKLQRNISIQLMPHIEAILLVWSSPYAVECQSITSALSLGFDAALCKDSCAASRPSRYYNSNISQPFKQIGFRPSMLLPTESVEQAKAIIDHGVASGFRITPASAYFVHTSDTKRNSRAAFFPPPGVVSDKKLTIRHVQADFLAGAQDVILYQLGAAQVSKLESITFLPGALADHLTSFGGDLLESTQMSSLRWLNAGATASYGTVSEPCNFWQKFPHPTVLLQHYLNGETAIEAYWKSVAWPAQGLFIGEPLAAPYRTVYPAVR